jgi:GntR family transcriptional regulator
VGRQHPVEDEAPQQGWVDGPLTALTVSASLAQIGEFSFILAGLGMTLGLLPAEGQSLILAGALPPGMKLPSFRSMAVQATCSIITARKAYENLEAEGFIRTRQGMGSVVAEIPEGKMRAHRREAVDGAFREAVRAGRRAGLSEEELRSIFEETLQGEDTSVHQGGTTS